MNTRQISDAAPKSARDTPAVFDKPIALVGLMGSGKSVIGRRLAKQLGLPFADSDQLVTKMAGVSITDIFDIAGEAKFRDMDFALSKTSCKNHRMCWPLVEGIANQKPPPCFVKILPLSGSRQSGTLLKRIGDITSRPLLQTGPPLEILQQLQTDRVINTDG